LFINKEKVRELMNREADGNYTEFSRQLDIEVAQLHRVLNTKSNAGPKMLGKLALYCERNNYDFNDYIFLNKPLTTCNGKSKESTA
jgi:hypothetical protein